MRGSAGVLSMHLGEVGRYSIAFLLYASLALVALRSVILSPGIIGLSHDWGVPPYPWQVLRSLDLLGSSADPYGREVYFFGYPGALPGILFAWFGLGGGFISKWYAWSGLALSGLSAFFLCRRMGLALLPSLLAGLVYEFAPMPFNRVAAGHIYHLLGYAITPACLAFFRSALLDRKALTRIKYAMLSGLLLIVATSQLQTGLFALVLLAGYWSVWVGLARPGRIGFCALLLSIPVLMDVGAYAPWAMIKLPNLSQIAGAGAAQFSSAGWLEQQLDPNRAGPMSALSLRLNLLPYFQAVLDGGPGGVKGLWQFSAATIVLAALSSVIVDRRRRVDVAILSILSIPFLVLSMGDYFLFTRLIWRFIFDHFRPLVAFVGELENLLYIPTLVVSVLFAITVHNFLRVKGRRVNGRITKRLLLVLLLVGLYSFPSMAQYGKFLQTFTVPDSYAEAYRWLGEDPAQYSIVWMPAIGEYSITRKGLALAGYDPAVDEKYSPKLPLPPQALGQFSAFGPYQAQSIQAMRFLSEAVYEGRTGHLGFVLSMFGAKYVLFRQDAKTILFSDEVAFDAISRQQDIRFYRDMGSIITFRNSEPSPAIRFAAARDAQVLLGDLSSLVTLSYAADAGICCPAEVFLPPSDGGIGDQGKVVISSDHFYDLVFASPAAIRIMASNNLPQSAGWSVLHFPVRWAAMSQAFPPALSSEGAVLNAPFTTQRDVYNVWINALTGQGQRELEVRVDGGNASYITTQSNAHEHFQWLHAGSYDLGVGTHVISLKAVGEREGLSAITIIGSRDSDRAIADAREKLRGRHLALLLELEDPRAGVGDYTIAEDSDASQGVALRTSGPGFADYTVYAPEDATYRFSLRARSGYTSPLVVAASPLGSDGDSSQFQLVVNKARYGWFGGSLRLSAGWNTIRLSWTLPGLSNDMLLLSSPEDRKGARSLHAEWKRLGPGGYAVAAESNDELLLARPLPYSAWWGLRTPSGEAKSFPADFFGQAYYLGRGSQRGELSFAKEGLFREGLALMIASWAVIFSLLALALVFEDKALRRRRGH